jgi:hypothetical protein
MLRRTPRGTLKKRLSSLERREDGSWRSASSGGNSYADSNVVDQHHLLGVLRGHARWAAVPGPATQTTTGESWSWPSSCDSLSSSAARSVAVQAPSRPTAGVRSQAPSPWRFSVQGAGAASFTHSLAARFFLGPSGGTHQPEFFWPGDSTVLGLSALSLCGLSLVGCPWYHEHALPR